MKNDCGVRGGGEENLANYSIVEFYTVDNARELLEIIERNTRGNRELRA